MIVRIIYLYVVFVLGVTNACFSQQGLISEDILLENGTIKLPGTLTYNSNLNQQPLVIFVHGSGNVDRDGNQASAGANPNYIKQLSDSLAVRNIAFYRYDKRSATTENLELVIKDSRFNYYVDDVNIVINSFKDDKRFSSITLIGHSQGSLVAMLADQTHVSKYISLAGAGHPLDVALVKQVRLQNGDSIANLVKSHFNELSEKGFIEKVDPNLMALFNKPAQPFILSWMKYNPIDEIKKLKMPILILNGDKDIQVFVEDAEVLHKASPNSKLVIIKNMNHTLKTITEDTEQMVSYTTPNVPLSEELVTTIEDFIKQ
ncbi:alpha/beta hydrolase [uncultured Psychroserpens sp.]|uniref:alpha/beta hydrolase n=1 Tax=uncultured Psychroserpens sp. TaxID=255436 RepID=UPI00262923B5|nr:alpha/beta hydrolase [uncultured Psychroserpens sp.]